MAGEPPEAACSSRPAQRAGEAGSRPELPWGGQGWGGFALRRLRQYGLPPRALAAWLAAAFALTLALILLAASSWMYWGLDQRMIQEDREAVLRKLDTAAALLRDHPADSEALRQEAYLPLPPDAPRNLFLRLRGADGRLVLQTPGMTTQLGAAAFPPSAHGRPLLQRVTTPAGAHYLTARLDVWARPSAAAPPEAMQLDVALNRSTEARILADYRLRLGGVLVAALLVAAAAGYGIAWRGLRPLRHMADAASRIGASNLHQRLDARGLPAELQALALAFNATLQRLEESFGRISQFSADIAHELRTPISNLWGELEVALGRPREQAEYREALESAVEECARLSQMIQTLLFLAQTEQPDAALRLEAIDIGRELAALGEFFEAAAAESQVVLRVRCAQGLTLRADRMLLQRALGNLIGNALAHTPVGGEVVLSAERLGDKVRIAVADTGCGIAPEHLPHLFERFYRADPARSRERGGLGLGLALVRNIVRLHGGEVDVDSRVGQGTRVRLELPAQPALTPLG